MQLNVLALSTKEQWWKGCQSYEKTTRSKEPRMPAVVNTRGEWRTPWAYYKEAGGAGAGVLGGRALRSAYLLAYLGAPLMTGTMPSAA